MIHGQNDPAKDTDRGALGAPARAPGDAALEGAPHKRRRVYVPLGRVLATPGALRTLALAGADGAVYLARHAAGDWGDVDAHDWAANDCVILTDDRLLSAYRIPNGERLWIITEADRSTSTLLLPDEY